MLEPPRYVPPLESFLADFRKAIADEAIFMAHIGALAAIRKVCEGIQRQGDQIWKALRLKKGDRLFELGPGHGLLALKAALNGVQVTVLEHPESPFVPHLNKRLELLLPAIRRSGGSLNLVLGSILEEKTQQTLSAQIADQSMDHIIALDVFRPGPTMSDESASEIVGRYAVGWREEARWAYFGIFRSEEVQNALRFLLRLKNPASGTLYINHTTSLARNIDKINAGNLEPDSPFREVYGLDQILAEFHLVPASIEAVSTTRNPLRAARIYYFGN